MNPGEMALLRRASSSPETCRTPGRAALPILAPSHSADGHAGGTRPTTSAGHERNAPSTDLVAAWPHLVRSTDVQVPDGRPTLVRELAIRTSAGWVSMIVNRSALPIYDVTIEWFGPDSTWRHSESRATLLPGQAIRLVVPEGKLDDDCEPGLDERDRAGATRSA